MVFRDIAISQIVRDAVLFDSKVLAIEVRSYRVPMRREDTCAGLHDGGCGVFVTVRVKDVYTAAHCAGYERVSF